jgi:hypothetical protein
VNATYPNHEAGANRSGFSVFGATSSNQYPDDPHTTQTDLPRPDIRLLGHRNEIELSYRNWVLAALDILITLGIAFLGGYAVYCFMTRFGE